MLSKSIATCRETWKLNGSDLANCREAKHARVKSLSNYEKPNKSTQDILAVTVGYEDSIPKKKDEV